MEQNCVSIIINTCNIKHNTTMLQLIRPVQKCYNLFKRNTETVSREYLINIAVKEIGTGPTDRVR